MVINYVIQNKTVTQTIRVNPQVTMAGKAKCEKVITGDKGKVKHLKGTPIK